MKGENTLSFKYKIIGFIITVGIFVVLYFLISSGGGQENKTDHKPDDIELMSYAQTILEDYLYKPEYSSYKGDYEFIGTGPRYKIEGKVNGETFWIIIEFTDETYKEYDLISLQVGQNYLYKK